MVTNKMESFFFKMPIWAYFFSISVIALPFTKAFTFDIGFPLKIYEVGFLFAIIFFFLGQKKIEIKLNLGIKNSLLIFIAIVFISTVFHIFTTDFSTSIYGFRGGRIIDMVNRLIYLLFNYSVFIIAIQFFLHYPRYAISCWLTGLSLAFFLHFLVLFYLVFENRSFLLPGIDSLQIGQVGVLQIPRGGTFMEGNFAGLYYLSSLVISFFARKWFFGLISLVGIFISLSTSTFVGTIFFLVLIGNKIFSFKIYRLFFLVCLAFFCVFIFNYLEIADKFSPGYGSSGSMRLNEMMTGINIFWEHQILGVGLGGYGHVFDQFEWQSSSIKVDVLKRISNNIYVELLSETGILGLLSFLFFYFKWIFEMKRHKGTNYFWAFGIATLIIFFAYPTFNITYLWCIWGFGVGATLLDNQRKFFL